MLLPLSLLDESEDWHGAWRAAVPCDCKLNIEANLANVNYFDGEAAMFSHR